jgi:hypothetical protein
MPRARLVLAIAVGLCLVGRWSMAQNAANLPASKTCSFQSSGFAERGGVPPAPNAITMNNDGGWCGHLSTSVAGHSFVFGAPMHLVRRPAHGQVAITVVSGGTQILYKPDAGFTGSDSFSVVNEALNIVMPYDVVVTQ